MIRRPPRSTRTDTLFPTRRSSDLAAGVGRFGGATCRGPPGDAGTVARAAAACQHSRYAAGGGAGFVNFKVRSEEHTSELQSLMRISYAVFCLKKKKNKNDNLHYTSAIHTRIAIGAKNEIKA